MIPLNQTLQVYKNLNREKQGLPDCWSVKAKVDGKWKVIAYVSEITITVTKFRTSETARLQIVNKTSNAGKGGKTVHAWIEGLLAPLNTSLTDHLTYIPYAGPNFFSVATKETLTTSNTTTVTFKNSRAYR